MSAEALQKGQSLETTPLLHDAPLCQTIVPSASHTGQRGLRPACTIYTALERKWSNYSCADRDIYIYMFVPQLSKRWLTGMWEEYAIKYILNIVCEPALSVFSQVT